MENKKALLDSLMGFFWAWTNLSYWAFPVFIWIEWQMSTSRERNAMHSWSKSSHCRLIWYIYCYSNAIDEHINVLAMCKIVGFDDWFVQWISTSYWHTTRTFRSNLWKKIVALTALLQNVLYWSTLIIVVKGSMSLNSAMVCKPYCRHHHEG